MPILDTKTTYKTMVIEIRFYPARKTNYKPGKIIISNIKGPYK
jgi:hypothetical protein